MGAESSVLDDYELDEPVDSSSKDWSLCEGRRKRDDFKVTVFIHDHTRKKKDNNKYDDRIARASQHLKVLKHPAILKLFLSYDNSEEFCMVTEPVRPLESVIQTLDTMEIIAGLYNIVQALVFLHDRGGLSHNNVCLSSVFVSDNDWGWRLGGMEHACKYSKLTNEFLAGSKAQRDSKSISPEERDGQVNISPKTSHSLDAYAFGMLVSDILDTRADLGDVGEKFGEKMQSLFLHDNPQMRPQLSSLLTDVFFRSSFLEIMDFLNHITIKSDAEKEKFFSALAYKLTTIPPKVVARRMLPRLLSRFVLAEPSAEKDFLPHLLTPRQDSVDTDYQLNGLTPILPEDLFREHCIPILMTLWSVKDGHARMILLKYFGLYGTSFDKEVLEKFILPQMLIGLRETNDRLVAATFSALSVMVPLLGASVVVGGESRKIFIEGRPKFNTCPSMPAMSTIPVSEKKISNLAPANVSGVIDIENRLSPLIAKDSKKNSRGSEDKHRKQEREQRRQEMEKRKEERKKEMDRRKLERERDRIQRSSPRRLVEKSDVAEVDSSVPTSDQEEFRPWEELDETPSSPRSDVTSGRSSQAALDQSGNYWSDEHSVTSDQDKHEMNDVEFTSQNRHKLTTHRVETSNASKNLRGSALKLGLKKTATETNRSSKARDKKVDSLGSEYEVSLGAVRSREPDFFADMEPSVSFKAKDSSVHSNQSGTTSSKLAMVEDTSQVESGWGEEEWENFD